MQTPTRLVGARWWCLGLWLLLSIASSRCEGESVTLLTGRLCPEGTNVTGVTKVSGEARRYVQPDVSKMRLAVRATADTTMEAQNLGNSASQQVVSSLSDMVNSTDIQTSNFELTPNYPLNEEGYPMRSNAPDNFTYVQHLDITTSPETVGNLLDAAIEAGNESVEIVDVVFYVSPEKSKEILDELRVEAIEQGINTATIMAKAAGGQIGGTLLVSDSSYTPYIPALSESYDMVGAMPFAAATSASSSSVVYGGEVDIEASVSLELEMCM